MNPGLTLKWDSGGICPTAFKVCFESRISTRVWSKYLYQAVLKNIFYQLSISIGVLRSAPSSDEHFCPKICDLCVYHDGSTGAYLLPVALNVDGANDEWRMTEKHTNIVSILDKEYTQKRHCRNCECQLQVEFAIRSSGAIHRTHPL